MSERVTIEMMIEAVKKHALENYNTDGWDFVVECWDRDDITRQLLEPLSLGRPVRTIKEAIEAVGEVAKLHDDRRKDIQGTAW